MKSKEIKELFDKFEQIACEYEGIECWSARELAVLLGYGKWENFQKVIDKAKEACLNAGEFVDDHFPDVGKIVHLSSFCRRQQNGLRKESTMVVDGRVIMITTEKKPPEIGDNNVWIQVSDKQKTADFIKAAIRMQADKIVISKELFGFFKI